MRRTGAVYWILILSCLLAGADGRPAAFGAPDGPNGGTEPVWSPDGSRLVFLSGTANTPLNIWVADAEGESAPRQLTRLGARLIGWSSDGSAVVCHTMRGGSSAYYAVDVTSGDERPVLTFLPDDALKVALAPDSHAVAYLRPHDGHRDLWVASADGAPSRQLAEGLAVRTMAWSPDGRRLAFDTGGVAGSSTYVVGASGEGEPVKVYGGIGSDPSWSPDGARLALLGMHAAVLVNADGSGARRLHISQADKAALDWSRASGALAITSVQGRALAISTVDIDSGKETVLSDGWANAGHARWSPDGRRIAFHAVAPGGATSDIYLLNLEDPEPRRLTEASHSSWSPRWTGDGSSLLFLTNARAAGALELYLGGPDTETCLRLLRVRQGTAPRFNWPRGSDAGIAVYGKDVWLLTRSGEAKHLLTTAHPTWASLAPDGRSLAYVRWDDHKPSLIVRQLADGEEREVLPPPEAGLSYSKLAWSPTGGSIALVRGGQVCTVPADGGEPTVLWSGGADDDSAVLAPIWSLDGGRLAFGRFRRDSGQRLEILVSGADGSGVHLVASSEVESEPGTVSDPLSSPYAWSPDGQELALCLEEQGRPALYIVSLRNDTSGDPRLLRSDAAFPDWSADGSQIAYTALDENRESIRLYHVSDGADTAFEPCLAGAAKGEREGGP